MAVKLSHVGIAIENLAEAVEAFAVIFNHKPDSREEVADQKVQTAMFVAGESRVELLEATAPDSPIARFVDKRGPGIHHIALQVDDIAAELRRLQAAGIRLIDETPRRGVGGALIAFIHPKSTAGILVELQQIPESK
jgi:methylmalonyl-CoA/ethylmalonyl-CoA epimerase